MTPVHICQISDPHIALPGSAADKRYNGAAGLQAAISQIRALPRRPDAVVITGDLVCEGSTEEYERLAALLAGLDQPVHLGAGNHDDRDNLRRIFAATHPYLQQDGPIRYRQRVGGVEIVMLDTLQPGLHPGRIDEDSLAWLRHCLNDTETAPLLLFLHHPPFVSGLTTMDGMRLENADALAPILQNARRRPLALCCGHLHRPAMASLAGIPVCAAPSSAFHLSGWLEQPGKLALSDEAGGFMLHRIGEGGALCSHFLSVTAQTEPDFLQRDGAWQ